MLLDYRFDASYGLVNTTAKLRPLGIILKIKTDLKTVLVISIILIFLKSYGQEIKKENENLLYIDTICKIISNDPDCLNKDIPFKYRTNTKDTVKYFTDKLYLFYKGKCDTTCYIDTTELYFDNKNLYNVNSLEEYTYIAGISKALKTINEPNLSINTDTSSIIIRFSTFKDTLPTIYRLEKHSQKIILYKKICSGSYIYLNSILFDKSIPVEIEDWQLIFNDFSTFLNWEHNEKFTLLMPDLLVKIKTSKYYSYIYLERNELTMSKEIFRLLNKIEKELK